MDTKEKLKQILDKRGYYNTDLIAEIEELYKQDKPLQLLQTDVVRRSEQLPMCSTRKNKECIKPSSCKAFGCNKPI